MYQMKPFRVEISIRNNRLCERREQIGLSAPKVAAEIGCSYGCYIRLETCKTSPVRKDGKDWRPIALKIAEFYGESPGELWPDELLALQKRKLTLCLSVDDMAWLTGHDPEQLDPLKLLEKKRQLAITRECVDQLDPRMRRFVEERFFEDKTRQEISKNGGDKGQKITTGRIQQIEVKTLRVLRHKFGRRLRQDEIEVGQRYFFDGQWCILHGFPSRNMVLLTAESPREGQWSSQKTTKKDFLLRAR